MVLAYMDNRAVQERFDEVFANCWTGRTNSKQLQMAGRYVVYPLSLEMNGLPNGMAQKNTQVEAVKGGLSGSMKRAAVQWGVGRYYMTYLPVLLKPHLKRLMVGTSF